MLEEPHDRKTQTKDGPVPSSTHRSLEVDVEGGVDIGCDEVGEEEGGNSHPSRLALCTSTPPDSEHAKEPHEVERHPQRSTRHPHTRQDRHVPVVRAPQRPVDEEAIFLGEVRPEALARHEIR
ncbi:MAG: hypothetical protein AAF624_10595, partial [Bacteroidota bacterium]